MLMTYGRVGAEQSASILLPIALNFVPPLFCLYLVALPFLPGWGLFFLAAYACALPLTGPGPGGGANPIP